MATSSYMAGRKKYQRPQAMLWADNPGKIVDGSYVPLGNEVNSDGSLNELGSFIILSDDNRQPIDFKKERIEKRERMVNGRMRSYHIADKLSISASWQMLPSRSFSLDPNFDEDGKPTSLIEEAPITTTRYEDTNGDGKQEVLTTTKTGKVRPYGSALRRDQQYTTDGGAGGVELLDWYENHTGSFWVYLSYDKYTNFAERGDATPYDNLAKYSQIVEVYFSDFSYTVEKRGGSNYDFWNISVTLEEV